ncbi:hypothetical protein PROFUN_14747 [Planoprotostelium fungivorum]|uniref:Uncharacterized protein n=1 Tax=Planoprotostelium fungivorum TaxID=1890364 RepID=A0A2P6MXX9_9EUKA|nr:hypothetical protein PROFUN_14747 [Planoprotostelium fungivorum]
MQRDFSSPPPDSVRPFVPPRWVFNLTYFFSDLRSVSRHLGSVFHCPFEEDPSSISLGNNTPTQRFESISSTTYSPWATIQAIHKVIIYASTQKLDACYRRWHLVRIFVADQLKQPQGTFIHSNRALSPPPAISR